MGRLLRRLRHPPQLPHAGFHVFGNVPKYLQTELVQILEVPIKSIGIQSGLTGQFPETERCQAAALGNQPERRLNQLQFSTT